MTFYMLKQSYFPFQISFWKSKKNGWSSLINLVLLLHKMLLEGKSDGRKFRNIFTHLNALLIIGYLIKHYCPFESNSSLRYDHLRSHENHIFPPEAVLCVWLNQTILSLIFIYLCSVYKHHETNFSPQAKGITKARLFLFLSFVS